jgi:hypothetical protein
LVGICYEVWEIAGQPLNTAMVERFTMFNKEGVCPHCNTGQELVGPSFLNTIISQIGISAKNFVKFGPFWSLGANGPALANLAKAAAKKLPYSKLIECVHCKMYFFECIDCNYTTKLQKYEKAYIINCSNCKKQFLVVDNNFFPAFKE